MESVITAATARKTKATWEVEMRTWCLLWLLPSPLLCFTVQSSCEVAQALGFMGPSHLSQGSRFTSRQALGRVHFEGQLEDSVILQVSPLRPGCCRKFISGESRHLFCWDSQKLKCTHAQESLHKSVNKFPASSIKWHQVLIAVIEENVEKQWSPGLC